MDLQHCPHWPNTPKGKINVKDMAKFLADNIFIP